MVQMNINLTQQFQRDLELYMKARGIKQKSEAVRQAVKEALEAVERKKYDFGRLLGIGLKAPLNPNPRFKSEDDLWKDDDPLHGR